MTSAPHTIGVEQTVAVASRMMQQHHVRHLPVLHGGAVVGVLSERDVSLIESFPDVDASKIKVEDAMSQLPFVTSPETPIDQVAGEMAEYKYGSAIVVRGGKVVGVFTTVDACRALSDIYRGRAR